MIDRRRLGMILGSVVAGGATSLIAQTAESTQLRALKYDELGRLIRSQAGKVVLVDLWRHD